MTTNDLDTVLSTIDQKVDLLIAQRDTALRVLRDIQDFVEDEVDGAPDSRDPLKHVGTLLTEYRNGEIPSPTVHARCRQSLERMVERAVEAEETERLLRMALAELLEDPGMRLMDAETVRVAREALVRPGRHSGPYTVDVYTSLDSDEKHPDPERLADAADFRRDQERDHDGE